MRRRDGLRWLLACGVVLLAQEAVAAPRILVNGVFRAAQANPELDGAASRALVRLVTEVLGTDAEVVPPPAGATVCGDSRECLDTLAEQHRTVATLEAEETERGGEFALKLRLYRSVGATASEPPRRRDVFYSDGALALGARSDCGQFMRFHIRTWFAEHREALHSKLPPAPRSLRTSLLPTATPVSRAEASPRPCARERQRRWAAAGLLIGGGLLAGGMGSWLLYRGMQTITPRSSPCVDEQGRPALFCAGYSTGYLASGGVLLGLGIASTAGGGVLLFLPGRRDSSAGTTRCPS